MSMQHSVFYGNKSTPTGSAHVREYDFQHFKPQVKMPCSTKKTRDVK